MKLIDDAKNWWRMHSIRLAACIPIITATREALPEVQLFITPKTYALLMAVLGVMVILGRLLKQDSVSNEPRD